MSVRFGAPLLALALLAGPVLRPAPAAAQELTERRRIAIAARLQAASVVIRVGDAGGSGFVAGRGLVVTNAHVVAGHLRGEPLEVRYGDGRESPGRLLLLDRAHDLALVEAAHPRPPRPLPLARAPARVGQTVLAFGSPFGLEGTLTQGIVSARRSLRLGEAPAIDVIQTDAPINPGNSGGPLVDARGRLVGVNTAILSQGGGSNGIGFAVPARFVRALLARHRRGEEPAPAPPVATLPGAEELGAVWLGILGESVERGGRRGVRVTRVLPASPAAAAGLLGAGDPAPVLAQQLGVAWDGHIILAVDGAPAPDLDALKRALERHGPGERATLTLTLGDGRAEGRVEVVLTAPPARAAGRAMPSP
ncbi:MAG: trypsin-like peptidase domain-containing protein [Myxococcota bacterium]